MSEPEHIKHIAGPGFAGDDGSADVALVRALEAHRAGTGTAAEVVAALHTARVLVPVVAVRTDEDEPTPDGLPREKETDMALVTLVGADGRTALPVFTSLSTLAAWRADARPVPVEATRAALSAAAEGADLLVIDVAGPIRYDVTGAQLEALARGQAWLPPHEDPALDDALAAAVGPEPAIAAVRLEEGERGAVRVTLVHAPEADLDAVRTAAAAIAGRLSQDDVVRDRARDGLDLVVVPPG